MSDRYNDLVRQAIERSGVPELVASTAAPIVILERRARAAGATTWFTSSSRDELNAVCGQLRPASCVSFYFDGRITTSLYTPAVRSRLAALIHNTGDVVVGLADADGMHLVMENIADELELDEYCATLGNATEVYFGTFPARDNDGERAVTIVLPDEDGIVRDHPH